MNIDGSLAEKNHSLRNFFLFIFILSIPIWLVGGAKLPLPVNLPVSALTAFVPMIAVSILCYRSDGSQGVKELFQMLWDYKRTKSKIWYLPVLLLAPSMYVFSFIIMRLTERPLPAQIVIPWLWLPVFFVIYWITGAGEELGWSGYATQPMQNLWGALRASFMLGVIWAIWHSIAFVQTGLAMEWVLWQSIKTVAMRMIIVWIYNKTGKSVFATNLYHTTDNVSWSLFPNFGTHYDPLVTGLISCVAIVIIILAGGFSMFSRSSWQE